MEGKSMTGLSFQMVHPKIIFEYLTVRIRKIESIDCEGHVEAVAQVVHQDTRDARGFTE